MDNDGNFEVTKSNIEEYLFAKGYFDATVETIEINTVDRMTTVNLKINEGPKYVIDSLIFSIDEEEIEQLFQSNIKNQTLLKRQYNQNLLSDERDRVFDLMTNNGYYDFKKQYVLLARS